MVRETGTVQGAASYDIDGRVNWIGIGPHRKVVDGKRGPEVTFEHFLLLEEKGSALQDLAPGLARRLYNKGVRHMTVCESDPEYAEAKKILAQAETAPPSPVLVSSTRTTSASRASARHRLLTLCKWQLCDAALGKTRIIPLAIP